MLVGYLLPLLAILAAAPAARPPPASNRCILDWSLPACALHPGECLQRHERVCLLPAAWSRLSVRYRETAAELAGWPEHCRQLREIDRALCGDLVTAAETEGDRKVGIALDAAKKASGSPLWARFATAALAGVGVAGAVWCALGDAPGDWPCWAGGGAGVAAMGIALFGW